jgi:multidrug resistance efflux pump
MVELIVGTYGVVCWLLFKKFKLVPVNTYTIFTAIGGGVVILFLLYLGLSNFHPTSHDGRMYAPVVQIVPEVRGEVVEVPVVANQPLKKGDVLFRIDPRPYQIEVDRLRASLAAKNSKFAQLAEQLAAAEAATRQARATLVASESANDRQLREEHEQAKNQVAKVKERLELADAQFKRARDAKASGAASQQEYDRTETHFKTTQEEFSKTEAGERIAAENLKKGSASLEADRQAVAAAEAAERKVRTEYNAQIDGQNPEVRETMALLDKARYDLDQTIVRAPTDGYVPQVVLRPGQMATATRLMPLMMFVAEERPTLVATFSQKVISYIKPGMEAEVVFKQQPGRSYKLKVRRVLTAVREGELDAGGQILTTTPESSHGYIPIVFDYDEDVANLKLPVGAQASVAVYTDNIHALSILRKIVIRIKSWENYVF